MRDPTRRSPFLPQAPLTPTILFVLLLPQSLWASAHTPQVPLAIHQVASFSWQFPISQPSPSSSALSPSSLLCCYLLMGPGTSKHKTGVYTLRSGMKEGASVRFLSGIPFSLPSPPFSQLFYCWNSQRYQSYLKVKLQRAGISPPKT